MYFPPAISPKDGTIYQMDEYNNVTARRPSDGSIIWSQNLPYFSQGAIALDSSQKPLCGNRWRLCGAVLVLVP